MKIIDIIKAATMCEELVTALSISEELLILTEEKKENCNCGRMSPSAQADDIQKANKKILLYIGSIKDKQRTITPAEISKKLGFSQDFIETILIANGFQEDY